MTLPSFAVPGHGLMTSAFAVSTDGQFLLASSLNVPNMPPPRAKQAVWLCDRKAGTTRKIDLPEKGLGPAEHCPVAFSSDGKLFAAASSQPGEHIWVWQISGQVHWETQAFSGTACSLAFAPDGKRLLSGMEDGSVIVWDISQKP